MLEFGLFTGIATVATVAPVYKVRNGISKIFKIPLVGWLLSLGYGIGVSWVLLNVFSFRSSIAGLANLSASIIFTGWLYFVNQRN